MHVSVYNLGDIIFPSHSGVRFLIKENKQLLFVPMVLKISR